MMNPIIGAAEIIDQLKEKLETARKALEAFEDYWTGKTCETVEQGNASWAEFLRLKDEALGQIGAGQKGGE